MSHPYTMWEDWQAGMYRSPDSLSTEQDAARDLLTNPDGLLEAMRDVCAAWLNATEHNLTDTGQNRRSWLGQAACRHTAGASRIATCTAWGTITDDQRDHANAIADQVIAEWEADYNGINTLFRLDDYPCGPTPTVPASPTIPAPPRAPRG